MDVSIIIINYQTPDLVIECIRSIKEKTQGIDYELIVVDNGSKDDSLKKINDAVGADIHLIVSKQNLGFGKANNLGAKYAQGKYIFLLNSDTILMNNAILELIHYLENHPDTGIVGGNLYSVDGKENSSYSLSFDDINSIRRASRRIVVGWELCSAWLLRKMISPEKMRARAYRKNFNHTGKPIEVGYIFGTDMMLSRSLFEEVNGFDPEFFMYAEEEELSWRITQKGLKIVSVPDAKIIHLDGGTFKRDDSFNSRQYGMRQTGTMVYYKKRFGNEGVNQFYIYKKMRLKRQIFMGKLLRRKMLCELAEAQLCCLEEQYQKFTSVD